ncbi:MAG: hypothetical protein IPJ37_20660 [Bacteroidales bacterium]|nr:hypothetical protein [Bacteroidales bacterium]
MLEGTMNVVLDGQHPVEILMEHNLSGKMSRYPLIIIPECDYLEASFLEELRKYVSDGGNLLIIGVETVRLFEKELGIKLLTKTDESTVFIEASGRIGALRSPKLSFELLPGTKATSMFYESNDFTDKGKNISSSVNKVGNGMIAGVYFNAGSDYLEYKSPVLRDFISDNISALFPDQKVKVTGSHLVHLTLNELNGKIYVNLVNIAGEHTNLKAVGYDEIPSLKNIAVSINTVKTPARILLQPEGRELKFNYLDGVSKVVVPDLPIYSILEVIPAL